MISNVDLILRLLAAALLGSLIGFERERQHWAAGLRTHMLVCVGSCLIMIVSAYGFADVLGEDHVSLDPSRVAAQVVSGIGFLGAGAILLRGEIVRGLTTAASLWSVAAIGLAVGGGLYVAAVASTTIILLILAGVKPLEERYRSRRQSLEIRMSVERGSMSIDVLRQALGTQSPQVRQFVVQHSDLDAALDDVTIVMARVVPRDAKAITDRLRMLPQVHQFGDNL
ncbi:MAG: MgtC/SapB family protein [Burkholderiaceae bacterium]